MNRVIWISSLLVFAFSIAFEDNEKTTEDDQIYLNIYIQDCLLLVFTETLTEVMSSDKCDR